MKEAKYIRCRNIIRTVGGSSKSYASIAEAKRASRDLQKDGSLLSVVDRFPKISFKK